MYEYVRNIGLDTNLNFLPKAEQLMPTYRREYLLELNKECVISERRREEGSSIKPLYCSKVKSLPYMYSYTKF